MTEPTETHVRWEPIPGLPEHPCNTVHIVYDGEQLVATAMYAFEAPAPALRVKFGSVEAFKAYEEFSDPWMETCGPQPMVNNEKLSPWVWPLQEVCNSRWIKRVLTRNGGIEDLSFRHFVIVTADMTLYVMAFDDTAEVELIG